MATWPTTLPAPLLSGYQLAPVDPTLRTNMEVGAARNRRQTKARNDRLSLGWLMTDAQMAIFRAWFEDDAQAAGGAAWFYVAVKLGNGGSETVEARFTGVWQAALQSGGFWSITAQMEVR